MATIACSKMLILPLLCLLLPPASAAPTLITETAQNGYLTDR